MYATLCPASSETSRHDRFLAKHEHILGFVFSPYICRDFSFSPRTTKKLTCPSNWVKKQKVENTTNSDFVVFSCFNFRLLAPSYENTILVKPAFCVFVWRAKTRQQIFVGHAENANGRKHDKVQLLCIRFLIFSTRETKIRKVQFFVWQGE